MNKKLPIGIPTVSALTWIAFANSAAAQSPVSAPVKSLGAALGSMAIFAAAGIIILFVGFKVFDLATPKIDFQKELLANNVAVAIVIAAALVGLSMIVAVSMV
jgi:uncharacterized membrane protein YjfL (UPF0719 family)